MDLLVQTIAVPFGYVCDESGFSATEFSSDLQVLDFEMGESCRHGMQRLPDVIPSSFQDLVYIEASPADNTTTRVLSCATPTVFRQRHLRRLQPSSEASVNMCHSSEDLKNILNARHEQQQQRQPVDSVSPTQDGFISTVHHHHHRLPFLTCQTHGSCHFYLLKKFSFDLWFLLSSGCFRCGGRHLKSQESKDRIRKCHSLGVTLRTLADRFHEDYAKRRSKSNAGTAFELTIPSALSKSLAASILLIYCWRIYKKFR
ncbi:uncharacterized protein LOC135221513 [Macrobrachium nipponense]|uniref:uncharacterized protein LOC135221513 n=1 Tax=Macrobrachium nipponense TaxID=159736 RepID=UPI0030C7F6FE